MAEEGKESRSSLPSAREVHGSSKPAPVGSGRRPTPVRRSLVPDDAGAPEAPATADFEVEGEAWVARVEGAGSTGQAGDPGAPLLLLSFARKEKPEEPLRETIVVGRRIDDFTAGELRERWKEARPYRDEWGEAVLFPETRRRGRSG